MLPRLVMLLTVALIGNGLYHAIDRASAGRYFFAACWLASAVGLGAIVGALLFPYRRK